jgi:hypothetical protein
MIEIFAAVLIVALLIACYPLAMAATANQLKNRFPDQNTRVYPVLLGVRIYRETFVGLNPAGYLKPHVPGDLLVGISCAESNATSDTVSGTRTCEVTVLGDFELTLVNVALTDIGKPVFATDDDTLKLTGHPDSFVGRILNYQSANTALVRLKDPAEKLTEGEVDGVFDLTWNGMRDFLTLIKSGTGTKYPPGWVATAVGATTAGSITPDKTVGEHVIVLEATAEAQNMTIESPYVFNIAKGFTLEFTGRNSVAGNSTDDISIGMAALSTTGLTATQRADMGATTAGFLRALFNIVANALTILASSDDDTTVVAPVSTTISQSLSVNTKFKVIGRPGGAIEFWINGVRVLGTTTFAVGATGIFGAVVNMEKSGGTGVPVVRIKNLRVAGALA